MNFKYTLFKTQLNKKFTCDFLLHFCRLIFVGPQNFAYQKLDPEPPQSDGTGYTDVFGLNQHSPTHHFPRATRDAMFPASPEYHPWISRRLEVATMPHPRSSRRGQDGCPSSAHPHPPPTAPQHPPPPLTYPGPVEQPAG